MGGLLAFPAADSAISKSDIQREIESLRSWRRSLNTAVGALDRQIADAEAEIERLRARRRRARK